MNILNQKPPIYDQAKKVLGDLTGMVFCYGDNIYFPDGISPVLPSDVIVHEAVHSAQQDESPSEWWKRYLIDPEFRLRQELQAFQEQYQYCCTIVKDTNHRAKILHTLALQLSHKNYGPMITYQSARHRIKNAMIKKAAEAAYFLLSLYKPNPVLSVWWDLTA